jgi:hypothetical protein
MNIDSGHQCTAATFSNAKIPRANSISYAEVVDSWLCYTDDGVDGGVARMPAATVRGPVRSDRSLSRGSSVSFLLRSCFDVEVHAGHLCRVQLSSSGWPRVPSLSRLHNCRPMIGPCPRSERLEPAFLCTGIFHPASLRRRIPWNRSIASHGHSTTLNNWWYADAEEADATPSLARTD